MAIKFWHVAGLTLWTSLIGPVMDVQPSRDDGPKIERRQPKKNNLNPNNLNQNKNLKTRQPNILSSNN